MKKITLNLFKGLLVIVLFTGVSVVLSTTGVQTVSEAKAAGGYVPTAGPAGQAGQAGQVSAASVNQYLINNGYSNVRNLSAATSTNWKAIAVNSAGLQVAVSIYTQGCQIIAGNESPL